MTSSAFPNNFPDGMIVHWAPLLVHPIMDGPECFVGAIAAATETGEAACWRLVDGRRLKAMFGDGFPALGAVLDVSVESLENHFKALAPTGKALGANLFQSWKSPFEGVELGDTAATYVVEFRDAFASAAEQCSAFGIGYADTPSFANPEAQRWSSPVAEVVKGLKPQLSNHLNAELRMTTAHPITFTFLGSSLAANVVVLSSQRMALSMREARAHLWNLSMVADAPDLLIKPRRLELLAGVRDESPRVRDAIEELDYEAKRRSVHVSRVESSEDAARRIIALAA